MKPSLLQYVLCKSVFVSKIRRASSYMYSAERSDVVARYIITTSSRSDWSINTCAIHIMFL